MPERSDSYFSLLGILLQKEEEDSVEAIAAASVSSEPDRLEKIVEADNSFLDSSISQHSKKVGSAFGAGSFLDGSFSQKSKRAGSAVLSEASSVSSNGGQKKVSGGASTKAAGGGATEKFRFLVVDDVSSVRKVIGQLLKKIGQDVVEAEDGVDAVEAYKKSVAGGIPFDCILMDFVMPHMDGPTATK